VSISLAQDGLQLFVLVDHRLFAVHVGDIFRDAFHWTRAEERYHGDHVMDGLRLHLHHVTGHAVAFQLEETNRVTFADKLIDLGVINRDGAEGELNAMTLGDIFAGFGHNREGHQPQEIHLEQTEVVDAVHVVLRHGFNRQLITVARRSVQRKVFSQWFITDDHASSMCAYVSQASFHSPGNIEQRFHLVRGFIHCPQFRGRLERFSDRHVLALHRTRNQLGDPVHVRQGDAHHPSHVAHCAAGCHGAEGNNLSHTISAVFLIAVFHYFRAAIILEIQVNIRHSDAVRVQEAFKQQAVAERLHRGDIQRESHQRAITRSAYVVPDVFLARETAQIPDDQEVFRKSHLIDNAQLIIQALLKFLAVSLIRNVAF